MPAAPNEQAPRPSVAAEHRQKLQAALDDLVACRRLIDAACAEMTPAEAGG